MFRKVKRYWKNPYYALGYDMIKKCPKLMTDRFYLKVLWKMLMGYELNLENPVTFNEKLQWLKLYDRNPLYTTLVDKYRVKQWVADRIGAEHVIPTLAVYKSVDEIDLDKLPSQFVLKCNHDSGSVAVCRDKSTFDIETAKKKLGEALKRNFYWEAREWPYKNVKPLVFAEKYMEEKGVDGILDYKLFTFDGEPKIMQIDYDRFKEHKRNLYDIETWNFIDSIIQYPSDHSKVLSEPIKGADEMITFAKMLSKGIPCVRADFYSINKKVYFGEMTFFHGGGYEYFSSLELAKKMGDWVRLPSKDGGGGIRQTKRNN